MGNGSDQVPLSVTLFMLTQPSKLLWVEPAQNPLSTVGSDFYYISIYLQYLGSFRLEPLKQGASRKAESRKYIPWFQTQGAKALNCTSEDADSQWTPCRFAIARSEDKCSIGSWLFAKSPLHVSQTLFSHSIRPQPFDSAANSLLGALSKFWPILQATVLWSYWTFFKFYLLDIRSLECQCWLDAMMKQPMWLFHLLYVYATGLYI